MERGERLFWGVMGALTLFLTGLIMWQILQTDFSLRQLEHRRKFGAVYMTLNNPFYEIVDEEIRMEVEKRGDVLLSRDPVLSVERQEEAVRELIDSGVEVIFINPVDWQRIGPALQLAKEAHVLVIAIDTNVEDDDYVATTVVSDNYMAGQQCARHLLANAKSGNIALLKHSETRSSVERIQGFLDGVAVNPSFKVVAQAECQGQLEQAMPAMQEMLSRHPEIDVVMALNDPTAMGAMAALQTVGRLDKVLVYGVDGVPETREMIRQGHMMATAGQSPRNLGKQAVAQAYKLLAGEPVPKILRLPTQLLVKENINADMGGWD
ncbi:monosaccharide ABC transporter substrate-binding protein, CUT2 family [Selenomonas ruminantium]|uniref:Monosaccharide ABC transporter substrate-binding protein, CUT2 family n=1 Tax=Selenomonas ruminantium TaxID=971 RepID=A0A1M6WDB1_SELRU|nr:sugar ABC transporter substrate-binding protein [Selenomonas ruminantium]SHK91701.1 monosaccharide ABC transporter substrate-binding protein, CUT2 family [Selenomonas ruminantium]